MAPEFIEYQVPGLTGVRMLFQKCSEGLHPEQRGNISLDVCFDREAAVENRRRLVKELGVDIVSELKQVHGTRTLFGPVPMDPEAPSIVEADGLATKLKKHALMIKTADCQPILFTDRTGSFAAAIHCGWKGNRQDYPYRAVNDLCSAYAVSPSDLIAVRGPSLGPDSAFFVNFDAEWGSAFERWHDRKAGTVDLWRMTRDQLTEAGMRPDNIYGLDLDTFASADRESEPSFFSYRRDHATGRQASLIWLE